MTNLKDAVMALCVFTASSTILFMDSRVLQILASSASSDRPLEPPKVLEPAPQPEKSKRCALLFFGLPRSYEALVLPSIVQNVLMPNKDYYCDVFAHAALVEKEAPGRSGKGGKIDSNAIHLLETSVNDLYKMNANNTNTTTHEAMRVPHVHVVTESEQDFLKARSDMMHIIRTTKSNTTGKLLYHPWATGGTYKYPTTMENMVRQWHSIEAVWNLMEQDEQDAASSRPNNQHPQYDVVAMLRSDVFYATPIDIYQQQQHKQLPQSSSHDLVDDDEKNNATSSAAVVLPGFAMYPVNDRMIIGSRSAVQIWATQRFARIHDYVRNDVPKPGLGMHSETFLNISILGAIQSKVNGSTTIVTSPTICFWRVRADQSVWISDCDKAKAPNMFVVKGKKENCRVHYRVNMSRTGKAQQGSPATQVRWCVKESKQ